MDPVLDPLLGRLTIKKGKYIKIGDKEVEYHPKFRLILQVRTLSPTLYLHIIVCTRISVTLPYTTVVS